MTRFIILCGGIGSRNNHYSLPKPLNYINGRHMIEYIVENIPVNDIYIIYNITLAEYNFEEVIKNSIKSKQFHFAQVEYLTRGAVETAHIGLSSLLEKHQYLLSSNESIVFIDNDNVHTFLDVSQLEGNFIGYGINNDKNKTGFSFINIIDGKVKCIEEKNKISDDYCCGIYGFSNVNLFLDYSKKLILDNNKTKNEFYLSQIYKMMILDNIVIKPVLIQETQHVGTLAEIKESIDSISTKQLRICFDLDNTLVSYPSTPGDYSTVKPIQSNIALLNRLKRAGHTIIIYTARRMATHNHNIGRVMRDIAKITLDTLEIFGIEYDEIIFGKPIADIYIDDKAINPYVNNISYFGLLFEKSDYIPNKIDTNKYNTITRRGNEIFKSGPCKLLSGELYFYQNIPSDYNSLFPTLLDYNKIQSELSLTLEYINGIPLYYLYKNQLLTEAHLDKLFDILDTLHNAEYPITISSNEIHNNYFKKLESRFNSHDYFFDNAADIYSNIIIRLEKVYNPKIVGIIHGDFWFSNILLCYDDTLKCIDMRGRVDDIMTLNGDIYYDYGKMYQSILGYDLILNNCYPTSLSGKEYIEKIKKIYLDKCIKCGLDIKYLEAVVISLIFGTIPFIKTNEDKIRIMQFINDLL